jgi:uncharacterized protein YkwD
VNTKTALGVAGLVGVAVALGVFGGLTLTDAPGGEATPTPDPTTPAPTPDPTATPVLTTVSPTTTPAATPTATPDPVVSPRAVEYHVYRRVNYLRGTRGYDDLGLNESLREVARYHSEGMAELGRVDHEGPDGGTLDDRLDRFGVACESRSETVGRARFGMPARAVNGTNVTYETAEAVGKALVREWMDMPTPRSDILRIEWTRMAVGVHAVERNEGAMVYATMVFCQMEAG